MHDKVVWACIARPFVGAGLCSRARWCHSEAIAEESRAAYFYFVLFEILHFVQNDKLGFVYPIVGANCVRPPADFDVILCGRGSPPLREKIYCVRRGRRLGAPLFLPLTRVDSLTV